MKLKALFKEIKNVEIRGSKEVEITGISTDSRKVAPGHLFLARKGEKHDGNQYIGQAVAAGARAIVTDLYDPFLPVPQVLVKTPGTLEAKIAAQFYGRPSEKLFVVGITGTKGKTTTSYLVRHLLEGLGKKCGLLGTVETLLGDTRWDADRTTRDAVSNQKWMREMLLQKCQAAVLEVSSHGLDQGRVEEVSFDAAIFTNLHPDHLDYHKTVENYAAAKKKLFAVSETTVINADSPWGAFMRGGSKGLSFGIEKGADLRASEIVLTEQGASFVINGVSFTSPLMGLFNIYNTLGAVAIGVGLGKSLEEIRDILSSFRGVPGRLERVPSSRGIHAFVDYAHTGESLENVLITLKRIAKQRLIVVFGCGGR